MAQGLPVAGRVRNILQKNPHLRLLLLSMRKAQRYCQYQWASKVTFKPIPSSTELMLFAKKGNVANMEVLLATNHDIDKQDNLGKTALHYAVSCGQAQATACLLSYNANHLLADHKGNTPLSLKYTNIHMLHTVRQEYRRFKKNNGDQHYEDKLLGASWIEEIEKNGIIKLSGLIGQKDLFNLQDEFDRFIQSIDKKRAENNANIKHYDDEEYWWKGNNAYITNNAFKYSNQLFNLCCSPKIIELAKQYYGREILISRGVGMRYLPDEGAKRNDQFQWHHDLEDKRLKMMVLLTDIGEDDQSMSYALGSHNTCHPYEMFFNNEYKPEYIAKQIDKLKIVNTTGKAGDIFLFDSNGIHRGNRRSNAKIRDAFFIEFSDDLNSIWGGDIPEHYLTDNSLLDSKPFMAMMSTKKKWDKPISRRYSDWVTDLPYAERWLR